MPFSPEEQSGAFCVSSIVLFMLRDCCVCVCVLRSWKVLALAAVYHVGRTINEAVVLLADSEEGKFVCESCLNFISNLDLQGRPCDHIVAVQRYPRPASMMSVSGLRRDVCTFCGYRPLGCKPMVFCSHILRVLIPSLLAVRGVSTPPDFDLTVEGGHLEGEKVAFGPATTLVFHAKFACTGDPWGKFKSLQLPPPRSLDLWAETSVFMREGKAYTQRAGAACKALNECAAHAPGSLECLGLWDALPTARVRLESLGFLCESSGLRSPDGAFSFHSKPLAWRASVTDSLARDWKILA